MRLECCLFKCGVNRAMDKSYSEHGNLNRLLENINQCDKSFRENGNITYEINDVDTKNNKVS